MFAAAILSIVLVPVSYPHSPPATQFEQAITVYKSGKLSEAKQLFQQYQKTHPKDALTLSYLGLISLQQRDYSSALPLLKKAAQLQPSRPDAYINLGNAYDGLKKYTEAVQSFQKAISLKPNSVSAYYDLAGIFYEMKKWPDAVAAYRKAASLSPKDPDIQNNYGVALQAAGNLGSAITAYRNACRLMPANSSYEMNLGLAALSLARKDQEKGSSTAAPIWDQARHAFAAAVKYSPADYTSREIYAETLAEIGHDDLAVTQFEKAIALRPNVARPHLMLGMALTRMNLYSKAIPSLKRTLVIEPYNIAALKLLGFDQFKLARYGDAVLTYRQLIKLTPKDMAAWNNLGAALQQSGDIDDALATINETGKLQGEGPQLASLHRAAGYIYLKKGDADSLKMAREEYLLAVKENSQDASSYNGLGQVAQKEGKLEEALADFQKAVSVNPKFSDAFNNEGVIYERKGDDTQAIAAYRKALTISPTNVTARANLNRLARTSGK